MSFSVKILESFQIAGYLVFWKHFPAAGYLDTMYNLMLFLQNLCWWNLTALRDTKEDFVLVVETFEPNYNKQRLFFNVCTCTLISQSQYTHRLNFFFFDRNEKSDCCLGGWGREFEFKHSEGGTLKRTSGR